MSKKRKAAKKPGKPSTRSVRAKGRKSPTPKRQLSRPARSPRSAASARNVAPPGNSRGGEFATFDEAKSAAIDELIRVIEESEQRLLAVKRAGTYDELRKLAKGAAR